MALATVEDSTVRSCSAASCSRELMQQWRRQLACRTRSAEERGPRPFVLVVCQPDRNATGPVIPLEQLTFFSLFDERDDDHSLATRLRSYHAAWNGAEIEIGGANRAQIDKDLRLAPRTGARGRRLDLTDVSRAAAAFAWERFLERCSRRQNFPRRATIRFPRWWCEVADLPAEVPSRREAGLQLVEMDLALRNGLAIRRVWAERSSLLTRQVMTCRDPQRGLCGHTGLVKFDLYHFPSVGCRSGAGR